MDISELESFKLSDAIAFHDKLNPKLFIGQRLRPDVESQLKIIADDFLSELGISGLDVIDITISGSNAAYSYTKHSDLDLHIIVDMSKLPNDEVYRELFNAKKNLYNDSHDIKIHSVPIELYVQDSNEPVKSLGEYSLLNKKWIKIPTKRRANLNQAATRLKYEKLRDLVELALRSGNLSKVSEVLKTIKRYRQVGLEKGGEFSPENLAYKILRTQGLLTRLYAMRDKLHSKRLSIESTNPLRMYKIVDPTYNVDEDSSMRFAAEKTPAINPYGGLKDRQYRGAISEMPDTSGPVGVQPGGWRTYKPKTVESASGYIPSNAQKNDPRFKTALTVDVKPDTINKNAKAFGFKVSRAGIPPLLKASGKSCQ